MALSCHKLGPMSTITVRLMESSDCDEVSVLVCSSYEWACRREGVPDEEIQRYVIERGSPEKVRSSFTFGRCLVAIQSDAIVGVIMTDENTIAKLYVEPSSVRIGVGEALFRKAEQMICEAGCAKLTLWAVFDAAIPFYESMGMCVKGRKFDLFGKGEGRNPMLMSKSLRDEGVAMKAAGFDLITYDGPDGPYCWCR